MFAFVRVCVHVCVYGSVFACVSVSMRVMCVCAHEHVYIYICLRVCAAHVCARMYA